MQQKVGISFAPWLDLHGDVKVEPDPELLEGVDESSLRPDERAGLDLLRAGLDAAAVVVAPLADPLPLQAEVPQAADEARGHLALGHVADGVHCFANLKKGYIKERKLITYIM